MCGGVAAETSHNDPRTRWWVRLPPGIDLPTYRDNMVYQAARRLFEHVGIVPPGLHLSLTIDIPLARGLGSSSSAIVGAGCCQSSDRQHRGSPGTPGY